jgi:hypothetical protein
MDESDAAVELRQQANSLRSLPAGDMTAVIRAGLFRRANEIDAQRIKRDIIAKQRS